MRPSSGSLAAYGLTVLFLWVAGSAVAIWYAGQQKMPQSVWMFVLPALLLESSFYIAPAFGAIREKLSSLRSWLLPVGLVCAAVPYLIVSIGLGNFSFIGLLTLVVLPGIVLLWYRILPHTMATDLVFLVLMATVFLSGTFASIYMNPAGKPSIDIIGRMMWIRTGVLAVLLIRGVQNVNYGFFPSASDWLTGTRFFLYSVLLIAPVALGIGFVQLRDVSFSSRTLITAAGTFIGMLWVVALSEEFFFRGMLQQILQGATGSLAAGIGMTSLLFGAAHLPMRGFPNWKFALCATLAGVFYGLSYARGKSIRASMVTHALVNTAWRVFFT
ncbi:MAG: CPBP family intramembrane metalloprotease [Acidobacteria bacterium]|nr:CPBP family intramembrane metalloprotease [Acidobacteriota bacterium]